MMPILVKRDDVRGGRKAEAHHGRVGAARESMGYVILAGLQAIIGIRVIRFVLHPPQMSPKRHPSKLFRTCGLAE